MTFIAVVGGKHSPGATTLSLALTLTAPAAERALLVEADPAGGDIAARAGRTLEPGLLSLAAAGRRGITDSLLDAHTQPLGHAAVALLGPPSPDQSAAALTGLSPSLIRLLSHRRGLSVVDAGRWDPRSAASDLVRAADAIVVTFRPTLEGVEHARARIGSLRSAGTPLMAVAIGERPYPCREVARALDGVELQVLPFDPRAASALVGGAPMDRWLARTTLARTASALHERLPVRERAVPAR
jgi:MinD-like ATPase involved in chromosome partitioning or flagellar assembly